MKTKIINFAPKNKFYLDILEGRKNQTIRDKPIEVGQKVTLWEKSRGMKKGFYCNRCFTFCGQLGDTAHKMPCTCMDEYLIFPRKIKDAVIKECVSIWMRYDYNDDQEAIAYGIGNSSTGKVIYNDKPHASLVKSDTPNWTNQQFIDFFKKAYPEMKTEPKRMYIWKW